MVFELVSTTNIGENIYSGVIDPANGFLYLGMSTNPGKVKKIKTSDLSVVSTINNISAWLWGAGIDLVNGFAYFAAEQRGTVEKIKLSDFSYVGALTLPGTQAINTFLIDTANDVMYTAGCWNTPDITKIRLSTFTIITKITPFPSMCWHGGVIDLTNQIIYIGAESNSIRKIRLSDFTYIDSIGGSNGWAGASPPSAKYNGYLYISDYAQLIRIKISDSSITSTSTSTGRIFALCIDELNGYAYCSGSDGIVSKVNLNTFLEEDTLNLGETYSYSANVDNAGFAYFSTLTKVHKVKIYDLPSGETKFGKSSFRSTGASVSGGIECGRGKKR